MAGVLDSRIALTLPMESGTGGTNIMRGAHRDRDQGGGTNGSQSPSSAYGEQAWLGDDFSPFSTNPNNLPIDIHEVIASIAPRGFLVLDKTASSAGQWLGIPSSHAAAIAAADVYRALGVGGNMHYINTPTSSHCQWSADIYNTRLQNFINIFLHRTGTPGTEPLFTATAAPSMTTWVNWTTPALTGQLTLGGCGSTPPSSSSTGGASSSSSAGAVSSSSANMVQTETCQTPLIAYPTNTVPSDPYNACFRYTNDKCYVCKIENEGEFGGQVNTCASSWVWNGSQIENNLEDGYWYHEVPCPGTSSSSTTSSSSSSDGTLSSSSLASSSSSGTTSILSQYNQQDVVIVKYYNLQGQPLGTQKPITSGVYIVRNSKTGQTQMTVVK
ncbi:MAG: hypothetical protein LBC85_02415 [Fibromonadaceae bacterium]|nr:hypothetical protein [Fibromonadaceae bacterium]